MNYKSYKSYCIGALASDKKLLLGKACTNEYIIIVITLDEKSNTLHFEKRYYDFDILYSYELTINKRFFIKAEPRKTKILEREAIKFSSDSFDDYGLDILIFNDGYIPIFAMDINVGPRSVKNCIEIHPDLER